jgi:lysozyme
MLADDLAKHAEALNCVKTPMTDGQKAAFVSFAYNVGVQGFCGSTLVRKANAGDMTGACAELSRWVMAGGKKLPGLVNRRAAERELCEKP